ncbi:L-serine ammonia-lyase [Mycena vitilis]|nr:L-serine ammonia-lyase [Mycena vitilis]
MASQRPSMDLTRSLGEWPVSLLYVFISFNMHTSTFDLLSVGIGPSSSHTVGPMRASKIFCADLKELDLLEKVRTIKITLYGSLAATGKGHHTPQAILLGLEGSDPETIDTGTVPARYDSIVTGKSLMLAGHHRIHYDMDRDMLWRWDQVLKTHPNGMRFSVFGEDGDLLATNEYFSVGGGFVVNDKTKVDENLFYKGVDKKAVHGARLNQVHDIPDLALTAVGDASPSSAEQPSSDSEAEPGPYAIPYPFSSGNSLLELTKRHNVRLSVYAARKSLFLVQMTIAQIVWDNEKSFGYSDDDIHAKIQRLWSVMDECIRNGVSSTETTLPGRLQLRRRAPMLYRRLMRGFYPGIASPLTSPRITGGSASPNSAIDAPTAGLPTHSDVTIDPDAPTRLRSPVSRPARVIGQFDHAVLPMPPRKTVIPAMDFLSCYAIAVNEVNASGGRIVTSPTNGAAGVIPAVLKYILEFVSDDPDKSVITFLLTASAVGMLFKRGSTISAAEGGCQAEVGVACSMASAGFAACMGASPETVLQMSACRPESPKSDEFVEISEIPTNMLAYEIAIILAAEIGIEHNLGLTCDPIQGLVQVPCIERNSLGAVKAVTAAQLSLASDGVYSVTLDEAIEAMRMTAADMSVKYKETSMAGLATSVKIPLTVPAC